MVYVSKKDETITKKPVVVSQDARKTIPAYYKAVQDLCQSQPIFMLKMREMEAAVNNGNIFLDIIRQVQLPVVQVMVRMRSEEEALQGKTYQELSLTQHLPNHKKLQPSTADATRTMTAFMYYALHKQLTGKAKSQQACSDEFGCKTTLFKHLVTEKKQLGRPGRKDEKGRSNGWKVVSNQRRNQGIQQGTLRRSSEVE